MNATDRKIQRAIDAHNKYVDMHNKALRGASFSNRMSHGAELRKYESLVDKYYERIQYLKYN